MGCPPHRFRQLSARERKSWLEGWHAHVLDPHRGCVQDPQDRSPGHSETFAAGATAVSVAGLAGCVAVAKVPPPPPPLSPATASGLKLIAAHSPVGHHAVGKHLPTLTCLTYQKCLETRVLSLLSLLATKQPFFTLSTSKYFLQLDLRG